MWRRRKQLAYRVPTANQAIGDRVVARVESRMAELRKRDTGAVDCKHRYRGHAERSDREIRDINGGGKVKVEREVSRKCEKKQKEKQETDRRRGM